jgi:DNA-binding LacI/PurR family transcriptional regulator
VGIPGEVSVTGFDNTADQPLTSIAFDRLAMGRRAVEIIASSEPGKPPQKLIKEVFPVELCVRGSTARARL